MALTKDGMVEGEVLGVVLGRDEGTFDGLELGLTDG